MVHERTKLLLENRIDDLCMTIGLWMVGGAHAQRGATHPE